MNALFEHAAKQFEEGNVQINRLLTDHELAAGIGVAVSEGDREWVRNLIMHSEAGQGFPPEMLEEFVDMVMGQ